MAYGSLNKVILIGNVGTDVKIKDINGLSIAKVTLATTELGSNGSARHVDWHVLTFYGKRAENAAQYLTKGSKIAVEGKIRQNKWKNKENKMVYETSIIAEKFEMLGKKFSDPDMPDVPNEIESQHEAEITPLNDLDIPF